MAGMPKHLSTTTLKKISYPESDGKPMADNTKQFRWIVTIVGALQAIFENNPNVFVAGDLLWYPVEGNNKLRQAPDAMVVFGRPKGDRGSYRQWEEDNIAPQVVFEVLSPGNRAGEMQTKFAFYERYGVEEYYIYDPDNLKLTGWIRRGERLEPIARRNGWVSPLVGIRFELEKGAELELYRPDGQLFATYLELYEQRQQAQKLAQQERQRAEQERLRAERLAARLRELNIEFEE